jgi:gamma-glutamylcyclotransferase (GGCT)/AIG2-like uncharacterized protein YtfP
MQNIFVYGTLKRGEEFSSPLADQEFVTVAQTTADYWMFELGGYPGLVEATGASGDSISGEVYRVDAQCRQVLDRIECVDEGMYELREIQLANQSELGLNGQSVFAYFYLLPVSGCQRLQCWPFPT